MFQFPSNGKVYSKAENETLKDSLDDHVSIPFKRESVFKDDDDDDDGDDDDDDVSIPFKRESVFKVR